MATESVIVVEQPVLVDTLRTLRQVNDADAQRILQAIRCLKAGTLTAEQLITASEAGDARQVIDAAAGRAA